MSASLQTKRADLQTWKSAVRVLVGSYVIAYDFAPMFYEPIWSLPSGICN